MYGDLFYSLTSFLKALKLEISYLDEFIEISNDLVSKGQSD